MNIFDFLKDISDSAKERIKTPITGSFTLAFLIYNWRPIFLLMFSDAKIEDKIVVINHEYCTFWSLLIPLIIALIYVVGVPYLMMYIEKATEMPDTERTQFKNKQESLKLKSLQRVLQVELENTDIKTGKRDKDDLLQQVNTLQSQINEFNDQKDQVIENYEKIIAGHKQIEGEKQHMLNGALDNARDYQKEVNRLLKISGIKEIDDRLSPSEINNFNTYYRRYILHDVAAGSVPEYDIKKFVDLKLTYINPDNIHHITPMGKIYYEYIK